MRSILVITKTPPCPGEVERRLELWRSRRQLFASLIGAFWNVLIPVTVSLRVSVIVGEKG